MQDNTNNVTDVEFKEVEEKAVTQEEVKAEDLHANFNPVTYMIEALTKAGHTEPTAWTKDLDPRAQTAEKVEDRMFFTNRALRLHIAEHIEQENITPRMIFAEGLSVPKWVALMEQGIVKWLMGKFNKKTEEKKDEVVIADGIDLPEGVDPENFNQSFDAPKGEKVAITDGDTDALPEGSMDSLPGSITE